MVKRLGIAVAVAAVAACTTQVSGPAAPSGPARDPRTVAALLKVATVFNNEFEGGDYGPVYDRWDARSQAIITRADYIRRHAECPSSPQAVRVEDASPGPGGAWLVHYQISGVRLTDYWFYAGGRWVFDLVSAGAAAWRSDGDDVDDEAIRSVLGRARVTHFMRCSFTVRRAW